MNGEEIKPELSSKDLIEHAAIALEEVQRTIEKVRKDGLKESDTGKATQTALEDVQRQIEKLYTEVLLALEEFPQIKLVDYDSDDSLARWEPSSYSEKVDQVSCNPKLLTEKVVSESSGPPSFSEKPPVLADSKNTDIEDALYKLASIALKEVEPNKLPEKSSDSSEPPPYRADSKNTDIKDTMKKEAAIAPKEVDRKPKGLTEQINLLTEKIPLKRSESTEKWEPPSYSRSDDCKQQLTEKVALDSSMPPSNSEKPPLLADSKNTDEKKLAAVVPKEVNRKHKKLTKKSLQCSYPYPSDSENSEAQRNMKKVEASMLGDPKKARKPPSDSVDEPIGRTLEETVAHKESLLVIENLSENGLTDEAEEDEEEVARLFEEVDRKFEKLFEEVALAERALPEPSDWKDCCPERALERAGLSNAMGRIFEKLKKNKKTEEKEPLSSKKPSTGSKK